MTREQYFKKVFVKKTTSFWCKICDETADFFITDVNIMGDTKIIPLCNECAKLLH